MKLFFITDNKSIEKNKVDELLSTLKISDYNVLITGNGEKTEAYVINKIKDTGILFDIFNREIEGDNFYTMVLNLIQPNDTVILLLDENNSIINNILNFKSKQFNFKIKK